METGPCVVCGLRNYPLSCGGPSICPTCDCGNFGPELVECQRREIERVTKALISEWRKGNSAEPGDGHPETDYFVAEASNFARAAVEAMREST